MKIRKAIPADAQVIADFNVRLAVESEELKLDPKVVEAGVAALLLDRSKGIYFVAETSDGIAGMLMITYEWSDWRNAMIWWLQSVYVKPEARGSGVFQALFRHVAQLAREDGGIWSIRLYMEKHNDRARRAYKKMGLTEMDYEVMEFCILKKSENIKR